MKKLFTFMIVLAFLVNGTGWAKKKSLNEMDSSDSGSKKHSHKKHAKGSKGSKSKTEESFNRKSEINKKDMTFDFKDEEKGKKKGKSKKKKEDSSDIPLEGSK